MIQIMKRKNKLLIRKVVFFVEEETVDLKLDSINENVIEK